MKELKRNSETGILEVWKDGNKVGEIRTMGDDIMENSNGSQSNR